MLIPVILSGGIGARLWPVSRESFPKPFIKLADGESLLQKTYRRAASIAEGGEVFTLTHRDYYFMSRDEWGLACPKATVQGRFMLEPLGRNTAAAVAMAALYANDRHGPETTLLILAADHLIQDEATFQRSVDQASSLAAQGYLVTFGIPPTAPETGYGYIEKGEALAEGHRVARFVEKPGLEKAVEYLESGQFLWNSGMFCFQAGVMLEELQRHASDIDEAAKACWAEMRGNAADSTSPMLEIPRESFTAIPSRSIDYAVMEHSDRVAVVAAEFDWSDVGSWTAVGDLIAPDAQNNRAEGEALFVETQNTFIKSDGRMVAALGLDNLMIIDTPDALLVAHNDMAQNVKDVVTTLKAQNHPTCSVRRTGVRPWGTYTVLEEENRYKIKRIEVWPGRSLSLQMHHHRSEHWVVVSGMARVINGNNDIFVGPNESTYIPAGCTHRLSNPGLVNLVLIEVQSGEYLEEDDIVRIEDDYGRFGL
jgi:mannose-1-phosphate guanylyltransferase